MGSQSERPSAGPAPGPLKAWVSTWAYLRAETRKVSFRTTEASRDRKSILLTPRGALAFVSLADFQRRAYPLSSSSWAVLSNEVRSLTQAPCLTLYMCASVLRCATLGSISLLGGVKIWVPPKGSRETGSSYCP